MKVLVTGGAGFIGSSLTDRLVERGDEVVVVDSFDPFYAESVKRRNIKGALASGRVTLIESDICDTEKLQSAIEGQRVDAIVHLAARAGVRPSLERPLDYVRTNIDGTQSLLDLARRNNIRPFVLGSSSSVYGDSTPVPFSEAARADEPISPYAATKRAAELIAHAHAMLHGSTVACLRLFTVYGPRQRPDLAIHKFARLMMRNEKIPFYGDGGTERDYTYVADVVDGIERALAWTIAGKPGTFDTFNLGESTTTSLAQLVELIAREVGATPQLERLPDQPGDVQRTFADITKARSTFGYDPHTTMEDGIRSFVQWLRDQPAD
ncbi:MAG TPA: GDP-mannose 4,6-dehydratase [Gemmatimonadaceae bacterium]